MKFNKLKAGVIAVLLSLMACTMTACKEDTSDPDPNFDGKTRIEIEQMYYELQSAADNMWEDLQSYQAQAEAQAAEDGGEPKAIIGSSGDGSGRLSFYSNDSKIVFPSSFAYPESLSVPSDGGVYIVSDTYVIPDSNWNMKYMPTGGLQLEHSSGISVTIKVGQTNAMPTDDELRAQILEPWFNGIPEANPTFSQITVGGDNTYGCQAITKTVIDSEDAVLRCGMFASPSKARSEMGKCVTYVAVYRGKKDDNKEEILRSLLNSLNVSGNSVLIDI